jgi:hypothetical protein
VSLSLSIRTLGHGREKDVTFRASQAAARSRTQSSSRLHLMDKIMAGETQQAPGVFLIGVTHLSPTECRGPGWFHVGMQVTPALVTEPLLWSSKWGEFHSCHFIPMSHTGNVVSESLPLLCLSPMSGGRRGAGCCGGRWHKG